MRIGVLTYHRVVNDGSVMQAVCLQRLLRRLGPSDTVVELIDLAPTASRFRLRPWITRRPPFLRWREAGKAWLMWRWLERHCAISSRSLVTDDAEAGAGFVDSLGYDAVVVGSDTVFEIRRDGYAPPVPNYYYRPTTTSRPIGFAVSADPLTESARRSVLDEADLREALSDALADFEVLAARDGATEEFLASLCVGSERVERVPDPTLLEDFRDLLDVPEVSDRPLAGVAVANAALRERLLAELRTLGYETVSLLGAGLADRSTPLGVAQRIGTFAALDVLLTDRFHGSIFALKHGRAAVLFLEDATKWPDATSKGRELYDSLGLGSRVRSIDPETADAAELVRAARSPHDPAAVTDAIAGLAERARPVLKRVASLLRERAEQADRRHQDPNRPQER